ncbi:MULTISPECIES: 4'-phosphopantetheinyl transferase family protein [Enterobacter cloacae complex]|uniref:4'-phosphopantetheinyl transferase family protein n=1 Tax=Enterobacter cloacae complex TaxID=354276 RepID=UPI0005F01937|nr:4'-phosphopantetheinyl transferase [Enterobacter hormaechei]ELX7458278.1 phosphopantetheinyl transferase [Enterobacter hormaechei subsp. hoffmannii]PJI16161.1 phosphopantetheinyl transferase [Enterobacter cloacae complex sp.]EHN8716952.1 phosphopantetheinyl transferase [Enterobacter hormaechei]EJV4645709.1 phosphopantetheinyl transferase [Enterobacter hormaechei]EKV5348283.1 phosphopantetheinyl transferase [Enterobacter hormaechei]
MATHFARGTLTEGHLVSARLSSTCHSEALKLPEHRRTRFLASRALLAELLFMLYGTSELPDILTQPEGRPVFADPALPHFSIAYTGNIVGVALTTEGDCGLDMELQRVTRSFHGANALDEYPLSSNEKLWIRNQNDPVEARAQLITLRQSIRKLNGAASDDASLLQLLPGSGRLRATKASLVEALSDAEDVLIWSVAVSPAIERLKIWEFDSIRGWRSLPDVPERANEPAARLMRLTSLPAEKAYTHS